MLSRTLEELNELSYEHRSVLVSYSGGKDSLVVLDLCVRCFRSVVGFFLYTVPNLECCERQLRFAEERYGIEIFQYPHPALAYYFREGVFCNNYFTFDDLPVLCMNDIYDLVREETGIRLVATGQKKSDSMRRRWLMGKGKDQRDVVHPIREWNKWHVLAYLKAQNIPIPNTYKANTTGINLDTPSLLWLHDNHPEDFRKLTKLFPYAESVVKRREYYGSKP